jgi:tetrapyrrole methylase family protein/MazG family protein
VTPRVVVVGLGPGGPDLVTAGTLEALARCPHRLVRTTRHPAAAVAGDATSCDDLYEVAERIDEVYPAIVERVVSAAVEHGEVVYAVPGAPTVAEHSVELLVADDRVEVDVVPALSFLDLTWARLGIDPLAAGVRVVDGHRFAVDAAGERGPLLVCQCDTPEALSDIKLSVDEAPPEPVVVLQRLGLPDESIRTVEWFDLDRDVAPDHLTSLFVPRLAAPVAGEVQRFVELVRVLREQCPWDREQTHESLVPYLVEEAYEVVDAIGSGSPDHLEEELGDLLFQVVFHATIAAQEGWFTLADVARGVHDKLEARHPHVFGDVQVDGVEELRVVWEQQKVAEKGRASVMDGIPASLPPLLRMDKVVRKAGSVDVALGPAEAAELDRRAAELRDAEAALGAALDALVACVRAAGR